MQPMSSFKRHEYLRSLPSYHAMKLRRNMPHSSHQPSWNKSSYNYCLFSLLSLCDSLLRQVFALVNPLAHLLQHLSSKHKIVLVQINLCA